MASAIDGHALPLSELDVSIDMASITHVAEFPGMETNNDIIALSDNISADANLSEANIGDDGELSTPNSTPLSASRTPGSDNNRRKKVIAKKPRRVRTGCRTCRERHLKCDEALHQCQNCRKSGRKCDYGIRLNFLDIQVGAPPRYTCPPGSLFKFQDESRHIASEYVGGFERYPPPDVDPPLEREALLSPPSSARINLSMNSIMPGFSGAHPGDIATTSTGRFLDRNSSYAPFKSGQRRTGLSGRACLSNPEEVPMMQAFVEEIGVWMDSMDEVKHFTDVLPFHALEEPMLLKAFMACGARHIFLRNPSYGEERASYLHDAASQDLVGLLQDPERDSILCATVAVLLNVFELMCSRSILSVHGMDHIAGARALIKECHWDGRTHGLGGACFWLNVSMELLSCLQFNWMLAWDPETWGVDMNLDQVHPSVAGNEEMWTHRMVYICAKVSNFRASLSQIEGITNSAMHVDQRYQEWCAYNEWCDQWAKAVPRSMMPLGYLHPWQTDSKSVFPEIWLLKRSSIVARLFYHTTRILLTKTNPLESEFSPEMQSVQQSHVHDICGIVAHVRDRGIASLSIRFLAIAAECLATSDAQEEILELLDNTSNETGWRTQEIKDELQEAWGWNAAHEQHTDALFGDHAFHPAPTSTMLKMPPGVVNPLMAFADFSAENHPYQGYHVAPHR